MTVSNKFDVVSPQTHDVSYLKSKIKLVVSDIDGTLLSSDHSLSKKTIQGLIDFCKNHKDVPFVIATGKTLYGARDIVNQLSVVMSENTSNNGDNNKTFGTFMNGAIIVQRDPSITDGPIPGYKLCHEQKLLPQDALWCIDYTQTNDVAMVIYHYNSLISFTDPSDQRQVTLLNTILKFHEPDVQYIPKGENQTELINKIKNGSFAVHKFILFTEPERKQKLQSNMEIYPGFPHSNLVLLPTQPEMLEIMTVETTKSHAVQYICQQKKLQMNQVVAFGDGTNDVEMIRDVGVGVAMANSCPELLNVAKFMTISNDESGVVDFLNHVFKS